MCGRAGAGGDDDDESRLPSLSKPDMRDLVVSASVSIKWEIGFWFWFEEEEEGGNRDAASSRRTATGP